MNSKPFRVRKILHQGGRVSYWVFSAEADLHRPSVDVLKQYTESSQQTYAYGLADHLNWLDANRLTVTSVRVDDLRRYMTALTGRGGVYGVAWRDRPPLSNSAAANVATVVKAFYLASDRTDSSVVKWFSQESVVPQHRRRAVTRNPLSPSRKGAGPPRFLPDEIVTALFEPGVLTSARDVMVVTWLMDSGIRVGGLCGLRFADLHLVRDHPCGQRKDAHVHIVGRDDNSNRAGAKAYHSWRMSPDGYVNDGVIRAVSEAMIGSFYAYLLDEYHPNQHLVDHEQVLIHTKGRSAGAALTTGGVRKCFAERATELT